MAGDKSVDAKGKREDAKKCRNETCTDWTPSGTKMGTGDNIR
jgi:hypothetical protein